MHLATVIILPRTATQDAYARLTPIAPVNTVVALPLPTPEKAVMPFMDPAFASAVCRYDLSEGPAEAHGAGEPGLYLGVLLHAASTSPITRSTTAPPAGA